MAYTPELLAEKKRIEQHVKIGSELRTVQI